MGKKSREPNSLHRTGSSRKVRESVLHACPAGNVLILRCTGHKEIKDFLRLKNGKTDDRIRCYSCMTKQCTTCRQDKARSRFSRDQWELPTTEKQRICYDCNRRQCFECHTLKGQKDFNRDNWNMTDQDWARKCLDCQVGTKKRGVWMCQNRQCRKRKPISDSKLAIQQHGPELGGNYKQ